MTRIIKAGSDTVADGLSGRSDWSEVEAEIKKLSPEDQFKLLSDWLASRAKKASRSSRVD